MKTKLVMLFFLVALNAQNVCFSAISMKLKLEAEAYNSHQGNITQYTSGEHSYIGGCDKNEWILFNNVNLDPRYNTFTAKVGSIGTGKSVEIRLDSYYGQVIGTLKIESTGGYGHMQYQSTPLDTDYVSGVHDIYLVFKDDWGVGNFDWFEFSISPYRVQAEDLDGDSDVNIYDTFIGYCDNNDYIYYKETNLGGGYVRFTTRVGTPNSGGSIEVRLDSVYGTSIGMLSIENTGSYGNKALQSTVLHLPDAGGTHILYLIFKGIGGVGNFDWFEFENLPDQAINAGYESLVFYDDFDSIRTIDSTNSGNEGFKWYVDKPFWITSSLYTPTSAYTVSNSTVNLHGGPIYSNYLDSEAGNTFKYGYYEARMRFDPYLSDPLYKSWPSWWLLSTKHLTDPTNKHWGELDLFESNTGNNVFLGSMYDWENNLEYEEYIRFRNRHNVYILSQEIDLNEWHIYGCLWEPGKVTWYFDGEPLMYIAYSSDGEPTTSQSNYSGAVQVFPDTQSVILSKTGVFSILDNEPEDMTMILNSHSAWPLIIDWVRVYQ